MLWAISLLVACSLTACSTGVTTRLRARLPGPPRRSTLRPRPPPRCRRRGADDASVRSVQATSRRMPRFSPIRRRAASRLCSRSSRPWPPCPGPSCATTTPDSPEPRPRPHPELGHVVRPRSTCSSRRPGGWQESGPTPTPREGFTVTLVGGADGGWRIVDHTAPITAAAPWWAPGAGCERSPRAGRRDRRRGDAHGIRPMGGAGTRACRRRLAIRRPDAASRRRRTGHRHGLPGLVEGRRRHRPGRCRDRRTTRRDRPCRRGSGAAQPDALARLSPDGRAFVIAHEAVHVRLRAELAGQARCGSRRVSPITLRMPRPASRRRRSPPTRSRR